MYNKSIFALLTAEVEIREVHYEKSNYLWNFWPSALWSYQNLLKRAKALGDYLIVGLSTNEFNKEKGKACYFSYEERKSLLESIRYVDLVIPERSWEQKIDDIKEYKVDVFVIGDDWKGKFDYLKDYCEVIYFE